MANWKEFLFAMLIISFGDFHVDDFVSGLYISDWVTDKGITTVNRWRRLAVLSDYRSVKVDIDTNSINYQACEINTSVKNGTISNLKTASKYMHALKNSGVILKFPNLRAYRRNETQAPKVGP